MEGQQKMCHLVVFCRQAWCAGSDFDGPQHRLPGHSEIRHALWQVRGDQPHAGLHPAGTGMSPVGDSFQHHWVLVLPIKGFFAAELGALCLHPFRHICIGPLL